MSAFFVVACGVPISAAEIAATAEIERPTVEQEGPRDVSLASSEANSASLQEGAPIGAAQQQPLTTLSAPETPVPTSILGPENSPVPSETATPDENSPTPGPSSPTPGPPVATSTSTIAPASATDYSERLVALLNQVRADRGLSALEIHPNLTAAAQGYARHMADNNYFGHTGLDGSTPNSRMIAAGYTAGCRGEALTAGQVTPEQALAAWLNSPPHAVILLEPAAVDVGVGYSFGSGTIYKHYWVLDTGPAAFPCA